MVELKRQEFQEASPGSHRSPTATDDAVRLLREELVENCHRAYHRGLVAGVSGNASIRLPHPDNDIVLIKTTGSSLADMTVEHTMLIDLEGNALEPGKRPSKEWRWHLGLYAINPDFGGIFHLHPPYCVAWAVANQIPPLVHTAARGALRKLDLVELAPSGSPELAELIIAAFEADQTLQVALMREHGMLAAAADLRSAYYLSDYLEDTAKVALLSAQVVQSLELRDRMEGISPIGWGGGAM